jgi:alpha-tubulin suppressor-like RCC1 family protein
MKPLLILTLLLNASVAHAELFSWGRNDVGQVGDGTVTQRNTPVLAHSSARLVRSAALGSSFTSGLRSDGSILAWGYNFFGQLGDGTQTNRTIPVPAVSSAFGGSPVIRVAVGSHHALALTATGQLFAWGAGGFGQIGDGNTISHSIPVPVSVAGALAGKTVIAMDAGTGHSVALTSDGSVVAWGLNSSGQLGDGTFTSRLLPQAIDRTGALSGKTITAIAAGREFTLALTSDGQLFAWGDNSRNQLGDGTATNRPSPVSVRMDGTGPITTIDAGYFHSGAITATGSVMMWGDNSFGQLGDGSTFPRTLPVPLNTSGNLAGKRITSLALGRNHSLGLTSEGRVFGWGLNDYGTLGDGTTTLRTSPAPVRTDGALLGRFVTSIYAGGESSMAVSDGSEIEVDHMGIPLQSGSGMIDFGTTLTGASLTRTFTIRSTGRDALTGLSATLAGTNPSDFRVTTQPLSTVPAGGSTTLTLTTTSGTSGLKTATLRIASNDGDENPFEIPLRLLSLNPDADTDGDGIANSTEMNLVPLGFDPLTDNSALQRIITENAPALGLFRESDMHSLSFGNPVIRRDPATNRFILDLQFQKSPTLGPWSPLTGFSVTPNPQSGSLSIEIPAPLTPPYFFRVIAE